MTALAAQLAVAVQNARLHEQLKRRDAERREALEAEQQASRTLRSLYEISRTLRPEPLRSRRRSRRWSRTFTELLGLDAAGIRMPDERAEALRHSRPSRSRRANGRGGQDDPAARHSRMSPAPAQPVLRRSGRCCSIPASLRAGRRAALVSLVPFSTRVSTTAISSWSLTPTACSAPPRWCRLIRRAARPRRLELALAAASRASARERAALPAAAQLRRR